jgi:hypothetical protein
MGFIVVRIQSAGWWVLEIMTVSERARSKTRERERDWRTRKSATCVCRIYFFMRLQRAVCVTEKILFCHSKMHQPRTTGIALNYCIIALIVAQHSRRPCVCVIGPFNHTRLPSRNQFFFWIGINHGVDCWSTCEMMMKRTRWDVSGISPQTLRGKLPLVSADNDDLISEVLIPLKYLLYFKCHLMGGVTCWLCCVTIPKLKAASDFCVRQTCFWFLAFNVALLAQNAIKY